MRDQLDEELRASWEHARANTFSARSKSRSFDHAPRTWHPEEGGSVTVQTVTLFVN